MKIDVLAAEIGSTTTVVNAFSLSGGPDKASFLGQGMAPTSVLEGDVLIGLNQAVDDLSRNLKADPEIVRFVASSSAAGGLRMSVHGLVHDMTVRAAREAALGAGGNLKIITSGKGA